MHSINKVSVTIALDGDSALEKSQSTSPMSSNQVIWNWIRLSPLTFIFQHVSGHQTDHVIYTNLDWWGKMNDKMDEKTKTYIGICTTMVPLKVHSQPTLYLEK